MAVGRWIGQSGDNWQTASDWSTGVVPGPNGGAFVAFSSIDITGAVRAERIDLHRSTLTLANSELSFNNLNIDDSDIATSNSTLSGTVNSSGHRNILTYGYAGLTLRDLTLSGSLAMAIDETIPASPVVTILDGLSLAGSAGNGVLDAVSGTLVFDDTPSIDAGTVVCAQAYLADQTSLTIEQNATLASTVNLSTGETLSNFGTLTSSDYSSVAATGSGTLSNYGTLGNGAFYTISTDDLINNGLMVGTALEQCASFLNDGRIVATGGASPLDLAVIGLNLAGLQQAGPDGSISLNNGLLVFDGALTTAKLLSVASGQHVSMTGMAGIGATTVQNLGATLSVGAGCALGNTLTGGITGGTIAVQGTGYLGASIADVGGETTMLRNVVISDTASTLVMENTAYAYFSGADTITGGIDSDGNIGVTSGSLRIDGSLAGFGTIDVSGGAQLLLAGSAGAQTQIDVLNDSQVRFDSLNTVQNYAGVIDLDSACSIAIKGVTLQSATIIHHHIEAVLTDGATVEIHTTYEPPMLTLDVSNQNGIGTITMPSSGLSIQDWTGGASLSNSPQSPATPAAATLAILPLTNHGIPDFTLLARHT